MKKFYSMVIAAIMAVFSFSAQAEAPYMDAFAGLNFTTIDHGGVNYRVGVHLGIRGTLDMPTPLQCSRTRDSSWIRLIILRFRL